MYISNESFKDYLPTKLSFYKDTYQSSILAFIDFITLHEKFGLSIIFSNTIFYPQGGGQKGDRGFISIPSKFVRTGIPERIYIKDTKKEKDGIHIFHVIENVDSIDVELFKNSLYGEEVKITIDWDFRFRQMRLHSIAHLLHFFTECVYGKKLPYPVSSDLQDNYGVNKYDIDLSFNNEDLLKIVELFQTFASEKHSIITYPDKEKIGFRYWSCSNYIVPCGGAHLSNTLDIGNFDISISSKKGKTSIKFILK